jgi:hypothetical protein
MTISGRMPKWRQISHGLLPCLLLYVLGQFARIVRGDVLRIASFFLIGLLLAAIPAYVWRLRRIISEFTYNGTTLQLRTLGNLNPMRTRDLSQITGIREWKGRTHGPGYQLIFRDKPTAYLELAVSNAAWLVERLQLEPRPGGTPVLY